MLDIDDAVPLPMPDGRAKYGRPLHILDHEAIDGIRAGLFADELDAAKSLAPKYRPNIWINMSNEQRRDYIKSKRKHYGKILARLDP